MNINPTNISDEEKTRIFNEGLKKQKPYFKIAMSVLERINL